MAKPGLPIPVLLVMLTLGACQAVRSSATPAPQPETPSPTASPETSTLPPAPPPTRQDTATILDDLGGSPCPDSEFTCVSLEVPQDHSDPANTQTIEVVFGVLPATGERKGMFVTVVGGPGGSGLAVADSYTSAFDPSITEQFDVVFFDQRGIAASGGLQCVNAATTLYRADWDATTPTGEAALTGTAMRFAEECTAEMGNPRLLPFLGTEQAVEDLEVFREAMQDERFWLYGESYGTQLAQTYAAAHPGNLAGLILDGPVDLTLSGLDYLAEQAAAFSDVLKMTLDACSADEVCAADLGGDPIAAYDGLASRLAEGPLTFNFLLPSGGVAERTISFADLETAASGYVYSEAARMIFLRSLAAAESRDDLVPMARVLYDSLYLYPETLEPVPDPTYSDAVYYGVECDDYDYGPAEEYLRAGDSNDARLSRLASIFYGDFPCVFWPKDGFEPGRPTPLTAAGIPTLVMVGTADPATPLANAYRIMDHLADGYLVVEQGGPHVIFGWGNTCVDDLVTAYLVEDTLPSQRETSCDGVVIDPYVPLPPKEATGFADPLEGMASFDTEIQYIPEYYYWDGETPSGIGCTFGGTVAFEPSEAGEAFTITNCALTYGFVVSGTGEYNYDEERFTLEVSLTGAAIGDLVYTREGDGSLHVTGVFDGEPMDLSE